MKTRIIVLTGVSIITLMLLGASRMYKSLPPVTSKAVASPITMCGTFLVNWEDTTSVATGLLPGLGTLHFAVTTRFPQAQEYFD